MKKVYSKQKLLGVENMKQEKTKHKLRLKDSLLSLGAVVIMTGVLTNILTGCKNNTNIQENPNNVQNFQTIKLNYVEQEYKIKTEEKIKSLLTHNLNEDKVLIFLELPVNSIDNLVFNFSSGVLYCNAYNDEGAVFIKAYFGNEIGDVNSYEDFYTKISNLTTVEYETSPCLSNYLNEEEITKLNNYILEQFGIESKDVYILNIGVFKINHETMMESIITIINNSTEKVEDWKIATYTNGNNRVSAGAFIYAKSPSNDFEKNYSEDFVAYPIQEENFSQYEQN